MRFDVQKGQGSSLAVGAVMAGRDSTGRASSRSKRESCVILLFLLVSTDMLNRIHDVACEIALEDQMKSEGFVGWYQLMRLAIIKAATDQGVDPSKATAIAAQAVNDMRAQTSLDRVVQALGEIDKRISVEK